MKSILSDIRVEYVELMDNDMLDITFEAMVGVYKKRVVLHTKNGDFIYFKPESVTTEDEIESYLTNLGKVLQGYLLTNNLMVKVQSGSYTESFIWYDKAKRRSLTASMDLLTQ